jgi:tRNA dimethylallyltransferase
VAVSADALQVYRGLETLTGVPPARDRAALEHRLVSFLPVDVRFSVGEFARLAHAEIDTLLAEGSTPLVVGGTGLYLRAALAQLDLRPRAPDEVRARWEAELVRHGPEVLHARLARRAPWAAEGLAPRDRSRIVRALELLDLGELEPPRGPNRLWTADTRYPTRLIGLVMDREALYARIDARVGAMLEAGAVAEVRAAHAAGASETARKALGFDELLAGDAEAMRRHTRNLARRQLTWMRKLAEVELVDVTGRDPDEVARGLLEEP